jgi:hypothetical protein
MEKKHVENYSREYQHVSLKRGLGHYKLKKYKQWFGWRCSELLYQRKNAKLQWLQDSIQVNGDNVSKVRREASTHFGNKKRECLKNKINELETHSEIKNFRLFLGAYMKFKNGWQPRSNLLKDVKGDLLADSHNIPNMQKNYFPQLLNVNGVSDVRQMDIRTAEILVWESSLFKVQIATEKVKSHGSPVIDQILAEFIQAGDEIFLSETNKPINYICDKEDLA